MHSVTRTPRQAGKLTGHKKTGGLWTPVPGLAALPSVGHGGELTFGFLAYITTRFGSGCIVLHCLISPPLLPGNIPQPQVSDRGGHHLVRPFKVFAGFGEVEIGRASCRER